MNERVGDLLFLAHRIPYPPNKGEKIRSYNEVKYLAQRGWRVHLCALADDPEDLRYARSLKTFCSTVFVEPISALGQRMASLVGPVRGLPLSVPYFYSPHLQRRVNTILSRYPIRSVMCFSGPMAEYVFRGESSLRLSNGDGAKPRTHNPKYRPCRARGREGGTRLVMDFVDVDSDKWSQYARRRKAPMSWVYRTEARLLSRYEARVAELFDATILVSRAEADVLRQRTGLNGKVHAVGNGVDLTYFTPRPPDFPAGRTPHVVFCGVMDYFPNVDAVTWFAREVLPLVRETVRDAKFTIVGAKPVDSVRALGALPGVAVTGRVDDVRPYVWRADVAVTPVRIARGIQNKVLEAMAMGKSVVTTPEGFEGIEAIPGRDLVVARAERSAYADAVVSLLRDSSRAREIAQSARACIEDHYRWESQLARLEGIVSGESSED